jgi:uncharacterized protein YegP (UPF0339 family)
MTAGYFELFTEARGTYRVRLVDGTGAEIALSVPFQDTGEAVEGINTLREVAATALIRDLTGRENGRG